MQYNQRQIFGRPSAEPKLGRLVFRWICRPQMSCDGRINRPLSMGQLGTDRSIHGNEPEDMLDLEAPEFEARYRTIQQVRACMRDPPPCVIARIRTAR